MLVTNKAPDFTAPAVMPNGEIKEDFRLYDYIGKNGIVIFFWPKDFTFVCPTEIIAMDHRVKDFESRGYSVIGISIDSEQVHAAWRNTPLDRGGIGHVSFPMIADITKDIAKAYDVLFNNAVALRGSFLIDAKGIVRHAVINDLPLGREMDEMLRMCDALSFYEENGEVCPAGWRKGKKAMKATTEGVAEYLGQNHATL